MEKEDNGLFDSDGNGIFGDLTEFIDKMISNMHFVEAIEKPIGYVALKNGMKVQITIKVNSNENEWIGK